MKTIAILQSSYIPWKGYFDLVGMVDEFILFDDVQYTRGDWRNRNRIKTLHGLKWLTIPVSNRGRYLRTIEEMETSERDWGAAHWKSVQHAYARAPFFRQYADVFAEFYLASQPRRLSLVNFELMSRINQLLGITTPLRWSSGLGIADGRTERLVAICKATNATDYLSGPSAADYIDRTLFSKAGIALHWMDYAGYPEYPQQYGAFEHGVTILDLIFNMGPDAPQFMKFTRK